jgi:hypothetical protein
MDLKEYASHKPGLARHPWEASRADFFRKLTRRWLPKDRPLDVLDIGSGDTWLAQQLLSELHPSSTVTCVDSSYTSEHLRDLNIPGRVEPRPEIPPGRIFSGCFLFDVIEHVPEDRVFLSDIVKNRLRDDGLVMISVPAYQGLFTAHDRWLGHFRRYSPKRGRKLVADCGLKIITEGSLFHALLYVRALEKLMEKTRGERDIQGIAQWTKGPWITRIIQMCLNLDWRVTEAMRALYIPLPGLSWWCVCKKA